MKAYQADKLAKGSEVPEQILSAENVLKAKSYVVLNKGGVGIDGIHADELAI